MISTWQFIGPPQGIDMTVPLMPLRSASVPSDRYGIDVAWLWEVLSVWRAVQSTVSPPAASMSIHPTASQVNSIRQIAASIGSSQSSPSSTDRAVFADTMWSTPFYAVSDLAAADVSFGTVPAPVQPGDPVRLSDCSAMFAWMRDAVAVRFSQSGYGYWPSNPQWNRTGYGVEGNGSSWTPSSPSSHALMLWEWYYRDWTGTLLEGRTGGGWQRQYMSDFTATATFNDAKVYWFKSAQMFLMVSADGRGDVGTAYVPLGAPTISQSGSDVQVSVACSASGVVQDAMAALSVAEVPYKSGMSPDANGIVGGADRLEIVAEPELVVFMELSDDYRYPQGSS